MKEHSNQPLEIGFNGTMVISQDQLGALLRRVAILVPTTAPVASAPVIEKVQEDRRLQRLAYSIKETAEILGVSRISVHRLLQRGLLRSSLALRRKIIPKTEIERFLKETSESIY